MAVAVSYPGVYIEEFAPGAPIQGVPTNVAAFVGPAAKGEINVPKKLTSWDDFLKYYGQRPLNGFFLWSAVRGFFMNGGTVCYIVRASNGAVARGTLANAGGDPVATAYALKPGEEGNAISLTVTDADPLLPAGTKLYTPSAAYLEKNSHTRRG